MRVEVRKGRLAGVLLAAIAGSILLAAPAFAQQKTVKQCTEEWRANKAENQAKGITEKAFVAQCRSGTAAAQPTAAPAAAAPAQRSTTAPAPRATPRTGGTTALAPPGSAEEAQVRARCPSDTVVWVNEDSKIYHFTGHKAYGTTKQGKYMCERDAVAAGNRAARNEKHP